MVGRSHIWPPQDEAAYDRYMNETLAHLEPALRRHFTLPRHPDADAMRASCARLPNTTYDPDENMCCSLCPPGAGTVLPCTRQSGNDTLCELCPVGRYSEKASHVEPCLLCEVCPPTAITLQPCTPSSRTKCQCKPGYIQSFTENGRITCRKCSDCGPGFRVIRECSREADRLCEPCNPEENVFTGGDNWAECKPCSTCQLGQAITQNCTTATDRLCAHPVELEEVGPGMSSSLNPVPIYCGVLGAVCIALIFYVLSKHLKLRCFSSQTPKKPASTTSSQGKASQVGVPVEPQPPVFKGLLLPSNKPPSKTRFGEESTHLCYTESEWSRMEKSERPMLHLLRRWNSDPSASVAQLRHALSNVPTLLPLLPTLESTYTL